MNESLRAEVRTRAGGHCEYYRWPDESEAASYHVDHIIAEQHGIVAVLPNLAWSCVSCNGHKGTNLATVEPAPEGALVRLFDPRRDNWKRHFAWDGPLLVGHTRKGRGTARLLRANAPDRLEFRRLLMEAGRFDAG